MCGCDEVELAEKEFPKINSRMVKGCYGKQNIAFFYTMISNTCLQYCEYCKSCTGMIYASYQFLNEV